MEAERGLSADVLTIADLQRELQKFAREKLPDLFKTFANETAKISCEQLTEVLHTLRPERSPAPIRAATSAIDGGSSGAQDHEWAHRHVRPAAVAEMVKPKQHTSVKEIWKAVVDKSRPAKLDSKSEHDPPPIMPQPSTAARPSLVVATPSVAKPVATPSAATPSLATPSGPQAPDDQPAPALPGLVQADELRVDEVLDHPQGGRSSFQSVLQPPPVPEDVRHEGDTSELRPSQGRRRPQASKENEWDALAHRVQHCDTVVRETLQEGDEEPRTSWWHIYEMLVYAWPMEYLTLTVILINAFCLGLETNMMAANLLSRTPDEFIRLGWAFCAFFTLEMVLKVSANPSRFFLGTAWQLNVLDFLLMALQWLDVVVTISTADSDNNAVNLNIMRAIRMVRLVRIVRSYRVLRMLGEVRAIIWSVSTSLKPLLGAVLVLMTLIYLLAVFLVDTCNYHRVGSDITEVGFEQLGTYYGSLAQGMLTLWQIITGGMDWAVAVNPLIDHTGPLAVFVVFCYIAFTLLALLNVITGVCVESAVKRTKEDKDNYLVQYVRGVFKRMESSTSGVITWEDFKSSLNSKDMKELFKAIDLDISEAHCVFKILDLDDDGTLDADEFLSGCLRLRGPAKALDVLVLMREIRSNQLQLMQKLQTMP